MNPSAVFILAIGLQTEISLSGKFLRNHGSMPKTFTHVLSTSRKYTTEFLVKSCGECCEKLLGRIGCGVDDSLLLAVKSLYSCSEVCVRVGRIKSRPFTVGVGLRQGCVLSPLLFIVYIRCGWMPASYTSRQPSNPRRHPNC